MKRFLAVFLIFNFLNLIYLPVLAVEKKIKKPSVGTFNNAVKKGEIDKVQNYLNAGFNPNKKHWKTWFLYGTPIIGTAISSKQNGTLDILLKNGASPTPKSIVSPLKVAIVCKNSYAAKKLIETENIILQTEDITSLKEAIFLLSENPITRPFWLIINGENPKHKPFTIAYTQSNFYNKKITKNLLNTVWIIEDEYFILINKSFINSSKEAIATLIASQVLHTDTKDSINEEAYSALIMATVWHSFTIKNPKLRNEDSLLVKTLNEYENDLIECNYDLSKFKNKISSNPTYKSLNLPVESPGFTNELLNLPVEESIYNKIKSNMQKYWNNTTMSEKIYNVCYFLTYTAVLIGTSYLFNCTINSSVQQSTFTTLRINSF